MARLGVLGIVAIALVLGLGSHAAPAAQAQENPIDQGAEHPPSRGWRRALCPTRASSATRTESGIQYMTRAGGIRAWFMPDRVRMLTTERPAEAAEDDPGQAHAVDLQFLDASAAVQVVGQNELPGKINYLHRPPRGLGDGSAVVRHVQYRNLWPGVDLSLRNMYGAMSQKPAVDDPTRQVAPFLKTTSNFRA